MPPADTKAIELKRMAEAHGWRADFTRGDLFQQSDTQQTLFTVSFVARRGEQTVTATWADGRATGPIGAHSTPPMCTGVQADETASPGTA